MTMLACANCGVRACRQAPEGRRYPASCPSIREDSLLQEAQARYMAQGEERILALAAARTEAGGYMHNTRLEDTMDFARRIGARHLGIASCIGLAGEAKLLQEILEAHGFRVESVICKVGSIDKEEFGLTDSEKVRPGGFEALCNPIGQAMLLNRAGTELNIVLGLCVGHDSLFFRHSEAPTTVLIAKDRVLGHNPAAALYLSESYYRRVRGG